MNSIADVSDRSIADLISLQGRTAVVTGAAQGLGRGIARRLAEAGANVVIGDRNLALAQETAEALSSSSSGKIIAQGMDVADADAIAAACARAEAELGGVDIWVNNAGVFPHIPVSQMTQAQWDDVFAVNTVAGGRVSSSTSPRLQGSGVFHLAWQPMSVRNMPWSV